MCEYKALDSLTKKYIKEFYKNYINYNEYYEGNNDLSYLFYDYSSDYIKNDEEALDFLSKNIKDIFEFNKKCAKDESRYKYGGDMYKDLFDGMDSYGYNPKDFLENYVHWNFCWFYEKMVDTLSLAWLRNHESLSEEWYNLLCIVVDNM